jgi:hypothetical protein
MSVPPLPDLDTLSLDELKTLVVQLRVRVSVQDEEIQQLRAETARLKDLPKTPKLAPGGMDKAPDKRARTKEARRQRRKRQRRTPPVTTPCHRGGLAAPRLRALHRAGSHPPLPPRALGDRPGDPSTAAARGERPLRDLS